MSRTPPLVVELGTRTYGWVDRGVLWITSGGPWALVTDFDPAPGWGGRVLSAREVLDLVAKVGRP